MSAESFHPTLVSQGYVTDEHREYAEWARRTYTTIGSIPGINCELNTSETAAGDLIKFYVNEPNPQLPDTRQDGLLVRRHPFGNGDTPHMRLWSQIISDVTGTRVVSFPNNIGREKFEYFSKSTKKDFSAMGLRAIALVHTEIVESQMLGDEPIYPFGWSEGGSSAAAMYAVSGDTFRVRGIGAGDPPTSVERSKLQLLKDFTDETGETFSEAAGRAGIPALSEALSLDDEEERKKAGNRWIRNLVLHPPLARIAMIQSGTLYRDIEDGLRAHGNSKVTVFTGEISPIAPTDTIRRGLEGMPPDRVSLLVLEGAGHGAADQIFDQAVIAHRVTTQ